MLGLGDNLHQRAIVKYYIQESYEVYLKTPWPQIYYDLDITTILVDSTLRAQNKNVSRIKNDSPLPLPCFSKTKKIWYTAKGVRDSKSILGAMLNESGVPIDKFDFSFNPKYEWIELARKIIGLTNTKSKPILFYRPLIERTEWNGCANRNPEKESYETLINHIAKDFFVISIADIKNNEEWISGGNIKADLTLHDGKISFEELCGLMYLSRLVFCSPGFALVMAQSMGIPNICVYGGRENSEAYELGARITSSLGINTIKPCMCFDHTHECIKEIDIKNALTMIDSFIQKVCK